MLFKHSAFKKLISNLAQFYWTNKALPFEIELTSSVQNRDIILIKLEINSSYFMIYNLYSLLTRQKHNLSLKLVSIYLGLYIKIIRDLRISFTRY